MIFSKISIDIQIFIYISVNLSHWYRHQYFPPCLLVCMSCCHEASLLLKTISTANLERKIVFLLAVPVSNVSQKWGALKFLEGDIFSRLGDFLFPFCGTSEMKSWISFSIFWDAEKKLTQGFSFPPKKLEQSALLLFGKHQEKPHCRLGPSVASVTILEEEMEQI